VDPYDLAIAASGGASKRSIRAWLGQDLSPAAVDARHEPRPARHMMSPDQESLLLGFSLSVRSSLEPVTLHTLRQFCVSHFNVTPSIQTLSRLMIAAGFSSQKAMSRSSRMVTLEVVDAALSSIVEIRSYDLPPEQVLYMDETGLWSNVREPRTYNYRNWFTALEFPHLSTFVLFCFFLIFPPNFPPLVHT